MKRLLILLGIFVLGAALTGCQPTPDDCPDRGTPDCPLHE